MKTVKTLFLALGVAAIVASCSDDKKTDPVGSWTSAAPESVTAKIADAGAATKTLTLDFGTPVAGQPCELTFTADYDVTGAAATDSVADGKYKVVATIKGTWQQDVDDQDDFLLTFDRNSLSVSGTDAPVLGPITDDFLSSLAKFTTIEDVEVSKDATRLSFETKSPEVKYNFVKK